MRTPPEMSVREAVDAALAAHGGDRSALHRFWTASRANQQARYEQILVATIEIAREEGYDAVQMRSVAQRSEVALATVYTYFQSRDHLVFRASIAWNSILTEAAAARARAASEAGTEAAEFIAFFTELTRMYLAEPNVLEVWVRSTLTHDALVTSDKKNVSWNYWARTLDSQTEPGSELEFRIRAVGDVFYGGIVRWAFGQAELDEIVAGTLRIAEQLLTSPTAVA